MSFDKAFIYIILLYIGSINLEKQRTVTVNVIVGRLICILPIPAVSISGFSSTNRRKKWNYMYCHDSALVNFFVKAQFLKTVKGIHLRLEILVHNQNGTR